MLFRIGKDALLSSWYHYKSCASVWMKVSLSWLARTHETNVLQNQHWPIFLSSWYHYKSLVNIWMKLNLSQTVRFMKHMKLRNTNFYKFGNTFEHGPSHPSTLFAFTHFELVNLGYHDNNQQNQCCLDVAELIMSFFHLNNVVIKHKYISLEMGESEFRWMAIAVRQISQLQPMNMGLRPFNL